MSWKVFFLCIAMVFSTACSGLVEDYLNLARDEGDESQPSNPATQVTDPYDKQVSAGRARSVGTASSMEMRAMHSNQEMVGTSSSMRLSISK